MSVLEPWRDHCATNLAVLREVVRELTYKPGYVLSLDESGAFLIVHRVPDSENPEKEIVLTHREVIDPMLAYTLAAEPMRALHLFQRWVMKSEEHEMDEWLRFHGKRLREPRGH